jgi:hypothetical protein
MANRWGIPKEVEELVLLRDNNCVYCGCEFDATNQSRKFRSTWEHIINDISINGPENIALCCGSCNASKGAKPLKEWLNCNYCTNKGITMTSVALVVKAHLQD